MILYAVFCLAFATSSVVSADDQQVCYEHVGCFDRSPPYESFKKLPASPSQVGTQVFLYTLGDKGSNATIDWHNITSLISSKFNVTLPVKVIVHGFSNSNVTDWLYNMKNELLKKRRMNVVIVTWGPGAAFPLYHEAVANTRLVARQVGLLLGNMAKLGVDYANIHMIGHSLGAHISGHVGEIVKAKNMALGRISGLDPAEPVFTGLSDLVRLDPTDAAFVDVIHTSGAPLKEGGFGVMTPCGHVDFFINGGLEQPDCSSLAKIAGPYLEKQLFGSRRFLLDTLADTISCSHGRANLVYIESINLSQDCQFTAYPCNDYESFQRGECLSCGQTGCGVMGYNSEEYPARGSFYLDTRLSKPYCGHHYGVTVYLAGQTATVGDMYLKLNSSWGDSEWMHVTGPRGTGFGHVIRRVTVAIDVIGRLHEISIKLGPQTTLNIDNITVVSGESGHGYLFCVNRNLSLMSGQEERLVARPLSDTCQR